MTSSSEIDAKMVEACKIQFTSSKNESPLTSAEEIVSSYTFKITKSTHKTTSSKTSTVSGINGVCVKQFSDGSLLPSYKDINMYPIVKNYDSSDKADRDTPF